MTQANTPRDCPHVLADFEPGEPPASGARPRLREASTADRTDAAVLLDGIRRGDSAAIEGFFNRYHRYVLRVLSGIMGTDSELSDALQETFIRAMKSLHKVEHPHAITAWLTRMATFTARDQIRKRRRTRWLWLMPTEDLAQAEAVGPDEAGKEAMRRTYAILDRLPADERVPFALRYACEFEIAEVAQHCGCSVATAKRRISRGQQRFVELARRDPLLSERITEGRSGK